MITTLAKVKTILQINDQDDLITELIPMVEADYLIIRNAEFDTDGENIVYPDNAELTAIKMIGYLLASGKAIGVQQESLGDYSVSYEKPNSATNINGYPMSVVGTIKRFKNKVKFV